MAHRVEASEPTRLLIAALGGEGGGVLAGWITEAAVASGLVVSRTSIPGVAQRTGATTYYIEMIANQPGAARPVLALNPAPGQVDVLVASELVEAARMAATGFISPDRTTLIASTHRVFTVDEKSAMADGRADSARLIEVLGRTAQRAILADFSATAAVAGVPISAVLLGALAASGRLPIAVEDLRHAITLAGKSVATNLAGFDAGYARGERPPSAVGPEDRFAAAPMRFAAGAGALDRLPAAVRDVAVEGVARLTDYQDAAFAGRYLEAVVRFAGLAGADATLTAEFARHLAVRLSVEDVIRVAQLKLRAARVARVTAEGRARPGDIVDITEFMKPGPEEILGLLPPRAGRAMLAWLERRGWSDIAMPLNVTTTRASGFLRLKFLAGLKRWRPRTLKFHQEQAWIARWIALVEAALARDPAAAGEVIATAKLVRGYGDTYKRGLANWTRIMDGVVTPALEGRLPASQFADAVLQARLAAEKDPEGTALGATLAEIAKIETPMQAAAG